MEQRGGYRRQWALEFYTIGYRVAVTTVLGPPSDLGVAYSHDILELKWHIILDVGQGE